MVQVLERSTCEGGRDIVFERLPEAGDFRALETDGRVAALWGTRQLIDLAGSLRRLRFRAYDCTFADYRMRPVEDDSSDEYKSDLLDLINSETPEVALAYMADTLPGVLVLSVALRGHGSNSYRIRLSQNGAVELPSDEDQAVALKLLREVIASG